MKRNRKEVTETELKRLIGRYQEAVDNGADFDLIDRRYMAYRRAAEQVFGSWNHDKVQAYFEANGGGAR